MCENEDEGRENNDFTLTACSSFEGWDLYLDETIAPEPDRELVLEIRNQNGEWGRYSIGKRGDVKGQLARLRQALDWLEQDFETG